MQHSPHLNRNKEVFAGKSKGGKAGAGVVFCGNSHRSLILLQCNKSVLHRSKSRHI
jgi:hypothetical protein